MLYVLFLFLIINYTTQEPEIDIIDDIVFFSYEEKPSFFVDKSISKIEKMKANNFYKHQADLAESKVICDVFATEQPGNNDDNSTKKHQKQIRNSYYYQKIAPLQGEQTQIFQNQNKKKYNLRNLSMQKNKKGYRCCYLCSSK